MHKDIGRNQIVLQPFKFAVAQANAVQLLEFFAEICLQRCPITNVRSIGVFQRFELGDEILLNLAFCCCH